MVSRAIPSSGDGESRSCQAQSHSQYCTFPNILELLSLSLGSRGFSTHERKIKINVVIHTKWTQDLTWKSNRTAVSSCHSHQLCHFAFLPMCSSNRPLKFNLPCLGSGSGERRWFIWCLFQGFFSGIRVVHLLTCQLICKQRAKKTQKRQQDTPSGFSSPVLFCWAKSLLQLQPESRSLQGRWSEIKISLQLSGFLSACFVVLRSLQGDSQASRSIASNAGYRFVREIEIY